MHKIEMQTPEDAFRDCYMSAGRHLQSQVQEGLRWLKADLSPPFLEHLSFRIGNQIVFVRLEDVEGRMASPGGLEGLLLIAEGWNGHPRVMPMRRSSEGWRPELGGWGLMDARTGHAVDPFALVNRDEIEMTDWELQDFAVQVVRGQLTKTGRPIMST